jgi:hypothetical protein
MPKRERFAVKITPPPQQKSAVPRDHKRKAKKRGKPRHDPAYGTPEIPSYLQSHWEKILRKEGLPPEHLGGLSRSVER